MTQPRKHRHAEMIRAWLDDDSLEVERFFNEVTGWLDDDSGNWYDKYEYRFKPKMIKCGDLEFPEPMRVAPEDGAECWVSMIADICVSILFDSADEWHLELLRKGVLHLEASDAEAHAHALIALTESKSMTKTEEIMKLVYQLERAVKNNNCDFSNAEDEKRHTYAQEKLKSAIEELVADAARLEWAMNNMSQHNYTLFGIHVMNVGGTGDIGDCREFVDKRIKEST